MHANRRLRSRPAPSCLWLTGLLIAVAAAPPLAADVGSETARVAVVPAEPLAVEAGAGNSRLAEAESPSVAPAEPVPPAEPSGKQAFIDSHDFLARDGGRWLAVNPRFEPGSGGWAKYGSSFEWGLGGHIIRVRISGFSEGGDETTFWEGVASWHPGENKVMIHNFGADGEVAHGEFRVVDETHHEVWFEIVNADGSSFELLDELSFISDDRYDSVTKVLRDGEWAKVSEASWQRQKS